MAQVFDELRVHDHTFVVGDVGAFEKPAQGLSDRRFRNAILPDEQIFQLDALLERILDGFDQISLPDEALIDQEIKGTWIDRLVDVSLHDHVDTVHLPAGIGRVRLPRMLTECVLQSLAIRPDKDQSWLIGPSIRVSNRSSTNK